MTHDPLSEGLPPGVTPYHLRTHFAADPAVEARHLEGLRKRGQLQREQELRERIAAVKAKAAP